MTDQLTPGQSLTREQVRNLPDGAVIKATYRDQDADILQRISRRWHYQSGGYSSSIDSASGWGSTGWHDVSLVSLPAQEPIPGEPQADPAPRGASEIEKEAASVFITSSALAMIEWAKKVCECERDVWLSEAIARLDTYRRAESYARSIGAIE